MVSHENISCQVAQQNSSKQSSFVNSNTHAARIPLKNSADWEQPDFEEIDTCMEITAYIYHWQ